jgi:hypothetical protein
MKLARVLAPLILVIAFLTVTAPAAQADPIDDCDFVPLRYDHRYRTDGVEWRVRTRLRVYDLCEDGTITGRTQIGPWSDDEFDFEDFRPYRPTLTYKLEDDRSYTNEFIDLQRLRRTEDWHPWRVTTDEDVPLDDGYFRVIRIRWSVTVDDTTFRRSVICDRVETDGDDAYDCS